MTKPTIIMKRLLIAALTALMLICISGCSTTYYEPVFGPDNLPAVIPSEGGTYLVKYKYEFYMTKSTFYYEWECRTIIDGKVVGSENFSYDGRVIGHLLPLPSSSPDNKTSPGKCPATNIHSKNSSRTGC